MQKLAIGALAAVLLTVSPSASATHPLPLRGLDPEPVPFSVGTVAGTIEFLGNVEGLPAANAVTLSGNISLVSELLIFRTHVSSGTLASIAVEITAPVTESHGAGTTLEGGQRPGGYVSLSCPRSPHRPSEGSSEQGILAPEPPRERWFWHTTGEGKGSARVRPGWVLKPPYKWRCPDDAEVAWIRSTRGSWSPGDSWWCRSIGPACLARIFSTSWEGAWTELKRIDP